MPLQSPVAIYYAKTNAEAMMLCHMLQQEGIEAHLMEDVSTAGIWVGGTAPNLHWPRIWVDKANEERAAAILKNYEQRLFDHDPSRAQGVGDETLVEAACEECGQTSMFSARILGSVQECPKCGKFMDVESAEHLAAMDDDWNGEEEPEAESEE